MKQWSKRMVAAAVLALTLSSARADSTLRDSVTSPAGSSRVEPGAVPASALTLSWSTFSDAADEAGISRRYGGIHFEQGDLDSRVLGRQVGALVWAKAMTYFNGTAHP
jgi:hypothetical protein